MLEIWQHAIAPSAVHTRLHPDLAAETTGAYAFGQISQALEIEVGTLVAQREVRPRPCRIPWRRLVLGERLGAIVKERKRPEPPRRAQIRQDEGVAAVS